MECGVSRQYELLLETEDECIHQKVGVRRVEVKGDVVYFNGVMIRFYGVNRHDSDPVTGYTISREQARKDLALMKLHNVNAIRTSHYPNAPCSPRCAANTASMSSERQTWSATVPLLFIMEITIHSAPLSVIPFERLSWIVPSAMSSGTKIVSV